MEHHLTYLDDLRESGETNMYGSSIYLQVDFPELRKKDAIEIVSYWMKSFSMPTEHLTSEWWNGRHKEWPKPNLLACIPDVYGSSPCLAHQLTTI